MDDTSEHRGHEPTTGATSEWLTPKYIFDAIGLTFDLDPAHPGLGTPHCVVPVRRVFTVEDDGRRQEWSGGLAWMNPPYSEKRLAVAPWLKRFFEHRNGIALVPARTSCDWFHKFIVPLAETIVFVNGKIKFVLRDGSIGKQPGFGNILIGMGPIANAALKRSGLGLFVQLRGPPAITVEEDAA
jgi:DNA N-6-adenine-methyltransferase (Dam)